MIALLLSINWNKSHT